MTDSRCEGKFKQAAIAAEPERIAPHTETPDAIPTPDDAVTSYTRSDVTIAYRSNSLRVYCDTFRCLYTLWTTNIAYGNVSLVNMMYKEGKGELIGILSDLVMKDMCRSPDKKGWERTGTLPFMALDLLEFCNGEIKRWYRHDLESSAWCLTYEMMFDESELQYWYTGSFKNVHEYKTTLLQRFSVNIVKKDWQLYAPFITLWLLKWSELHNELYSLVRMTLLITKSEEFEKREAYNSDHPDEGFIRQAVDIAKNLGLDKGIEALEVTSWIDVQLQNLPIPDVTPER